MEDTRRDLHDSDLNSLVPDLRVDRRGFVAELPQGCGRRRVEAHACLVQEKRRRVNLVAHKKLSRRRRPLS